MEETKRLFKKLKITTILELALITPTSYNDTTLSSEIIPSKIGTFEAIVKEVESIGGKLRVSFWLSAFHQPLYATFFRTTPYHYGLFRVGSVHIIQGRVEVYHQMLQMSQPKSLKEIGKITPKYKTVLKESEMRALMETYLHRQNLLREGLNQSEAEKIIAIHFPPHKEAILDASGLRLEMVETLKFVEALNHLKKLRTKRVNYPAIRALNGDTSPFLERLPFALTSEQNQVIDAIRLDLAKSHKAAKRMVVGDVGSGKTMVILASVMIALPHKSILMAPTSLLALQLYEEACKYLPPTISIALAMQSRAEGNFESADFVIGTHALLYKEHLPEVSLVMIDEQHRFGTQQRQQLEALSNAQEGKRTHTIQFSATPIPRTQAMMDSELIDVSLITTTPFVRDVTTISISKPDFGKLLGHISLEIEAGHQVLVVYPLVEESDEVPYQSLEESRGFWEKRFEDVYVTHGKDKNKEDKLLEFRQKGKILLATTVIEVGISLPKLTLIIIVGAERMGLATLHQLRGRVGRNGLKSWCYLYSHSTPNERLREFADTTSGFDIAKLDLKFRNSGDILDGTIQSGQRFRWLDMAEDEAIIAKAKERLNVSIR